MQFVTVLLFICICIKKYGLQKSVSEYACYLNRKWLFTGLCFVLAIPTAVMFPCVWMILYAASLCIAGVYTQIHDQKIRPIHIIGAFAGIVCAFMGIGFHLSMWWPSIIIVLFAVPMIIRKPKGWILWIEVMAIVLILSALQIYKYIQL